MELDISNSMWVGGGGAPPLIVAQKCEEIIEVFNTAKQQLSNSGGCLHQLPLDYHHPYQPAEMEAVFEYAHHHHPNNKGKGKEEVRVSLKADSGGKDQEFGVHGIMTDIGGSSTSGLRSSSSRRSSSRNDEEGRYRRVRMAAPKIGNTEMPPEDGFTWRKYGQKEILNAKYPRSYYRCTHQKLYKCKAKKQVQRLDDDPFTFDILYREEHTCHMSNTAPSSVPSPPSQTVQDIFLTPHHPITTVASPYHEWLSIDHSTKPSLFESACTTFVEHQQQQELLYRVSSSSSILCTSNAEGETSTVRSHIGRDHQAVDLLNNHHMVDWTEMFNSGSSSSNSMELIFAPTQDKWDNKIRKG
ncbi:hypothetical protein SOVF_014630 [Spinacia oleracea]|nr:hypothetical protein SOVF_014630 [Spinacia oleracea]